MNRPGIAAVVLAAGAGTRFDGHGHKLLADLDGVPVLRRAVDAAVASGIGPVLVVTGTADISSALADLVDSEAVRLVPVAGEAPDQSRSLWAGIEAARKLLSGRKQTVEAVVVGLADMPLVPASAWRAVAEAPAPAGSLVVAGYPGSTGDLSATVRRPPVRIPVDRWAELPRSGDTGARRLLRSRPGDVVEVAVEGDPLDVDRLEDLQRARVAVGGGFGSG